MEKYIASGAFLIVLLIVGSPVVSALHTETSTPLPYQYTLPGGYFLPDEVIAPATPTILSVTANSNTSISTAIMTNQEFTSFNDGVTDIGNSHPLYVLNSSTVQHSTSVSEGIYYVIFYSNTYTANITYNIQTFPITPYYADPITPPAPTGIVSYGLYNNSGTVTPYTIRSTEVVGVADIASLQAFNGTAGFYNDTLSGATLQLNSLLVVNEQGGRQQVYWTQDTPDFVTSAEQVSWADNIWNASVSGFLSNSTITSVNGGYTSTFPYYGSTGYYYSYQSLNHTYSFPFALALVMSETTLPGLGVAVQMGAQVLGNGSPLASNIDWFDTATIYDSTVQSAYFEVTGNDTAPDGLYYATEFVFGGEANGEATTFQSLDASLGLFYGNSTTGQQTAYPSLYTFGANTGEAAENLQVSYLASGFSTVSPGSPDYGYLGTVAGTFTLPQAGTTVSIPIASVTTTSQSASTIAVASGSSGSTLIAAAAVIGIAIVVAALVVSRRKGGEQGAAPEAPSFSTLPVSRYCANCGSPIGPEVRFCPNCGAQQVSDWASPS